jgi:type II restriction/modification system DNA methylase subunit YeeA
LLNPTVNLQIADVVRLPLPLFDGQTLDALDGETALTLMQLAKSDWDAFETSWDFSTLPLLSPDHKAGTLDASYARLRAHWQGMTDEMKRLEEENNRIFIDAYGLQDELTPEVPIDAITLTCNPFYSIGTGNTDADREQALLERTMAEFLSYAVGCMFGRYSLDAPGLILANQGETLADYLARVPEPSFLPDEDNVIPVLSEEFENWFPDDIADRFRKFLRVTFGDAHFRENLAFVEAQIGDIRKYFAKGFYDDHVKRYKKRPIYWIFSSPKGTFQALIYMHRYRPDTVSVLLNDYLREFIRKLEAERARLAKMADDPSATQAQRTKAEKAAGTIVKQIAELEEWERDVIFPLAQEKKEIDLDDGVKRNYPQFGAALKPIKGLEAADE